jgi:hypothetical protein
MSLFVKKILPFLLIFLAFFLILFLVFPKKITKEKIETNITQVTTQIENIKETVAPEPTKMLASGLPSKYLIKTIFIKQAPEENWDEPWQDACEEASLLTVDYFYKNINSITTDQNRDAILKMIDFENQQGFSSDMNVSQMATVATKYLNYQNKIIDNPTIDDIKEYLAKNIPVIVPASGKILYQENKHFNAGGPYYHNLVILGYDDDKKQFTVHDVGTKAGAYFHYSYSVLIDSIHDFPPSGQKEDINNGQKRVLILLK